MDESIKAALLIGSVTYAGTLIALAPDANASIIGTGRVSGQIVPSVMSPERAFQLLQQGQYSTVRAAKISQYFTYGDVFSSKKSAQNHQIKSELVNRGAEGLNLLKGAKKHAERLDRLRVLARMNINVLSWWRFNGGIGHKQAMAIDVNDGHNNKIRLYNVAKANAKSLGFTELGLSAPGAPSKLHIGSPVRDGGRLTVWQYDRAGNPVNFRFG